MKQTFSQPPSLAPLAVLAFTVCTWKYQVDTEVTNPYLVRIAF